MLLLQLLSLLLDFCFLGFPLLMLFLCLLLSSLKLLPVKLCFWLSVFQIDIAVEAGAICVLLGHRWRKTLGPVLVPEYLDESIFKYGLRRAVCVVRGLPHIVFNDGEMLVRLHGHLNYVAELREKAADLVLVKILLRYVLHDDGTLSSVMDGPVGGERGAATASLPCSSPTTSTTPTA